jgi:hypothetical protein
MDADDVAQTLDNLSPVRLRALAKEGGRVEGMEKLRGDDTYVVTFDGNGREETHWFRVSDGLLVQSRRPSLDGGVQLEQLDLYVPFGELQLQLPSQRTTSAGGQTMIVRVIRVEFNPAFEDGVFDLRP